VFTVEVVVIEVEVTRDRVEKEISRAVEEGLLCTGEDTVI
jgi:hypothetical protein